MAKKNANKKELDRAVGNALFSDTERMEMWFADHWKKVLVIVLVVLVAVTAGFGVWKYRAYRRQVAVTALKNSKTVEDLEKNLKLYGDSEAAPAARFRLGITYMASEKPDYAKAIENFKKVVDDPKSEPALKEQARYLSINCVEMSGNYQQAAAEYAAFGDDARMTPVKRAAAYFRAAQLLLALGDIKGAEAILAKPRLIANSQAIALWNQQLDMLALAVKNGDYAAPAKSAPAAPAETAPAAPAAK